MITKGNTGPNTSQGPEGTLGAIHLWARQSVHYAVVLAITACGSQTDLATPPPPPPSSLVLQLKPDAEDLNTAAALGWTNGIPAAEVTLEPVAPTQGPPRTFQSAADGKVSLEGLPSGRYEVSARRWLTVTERSQLPAGDDGIGFVSKSEISTPGSFPLELRVPASRRRALVLSEWAGLPLDDPAHPGTDTYPFSGYLRLYNNADTTVYLDGLIVGRALAVGFDYPNFPCTGYDPFSNDADGVWARPFQQLPGQGRDYPLPPGQTAVLATDAIDHRPLALANTGLDLRFANFEFAGAADADNPAVPNALDVGLWNMPFGHGLIFSALDNVVFVSQPVNLGTLPRQTIVTTDYLRFPRSKLLEVVAIATTYDGGYAVCPQLVHQNFDRRAVRLTGSNFDDFLFAYHRLPTPVVIGGRTILQHTRTSAVDFVLGDRTPFARP